MKVAIEQEKPAFQPVRLVIVIENESEREALLALSLCASGVPQLVASTRGLQTTERVKLHVFLREIAHVLTFGNPTEGKVE